MSIASQRDDSRIQKDDLYKDKAMLLQKFSLVLKGENACGLVACGPTEGRREADHG